LLGKSIDDNAGVDENLDSQINAKVNATVEENNSKDNEVLATPVISTHDEVTKIHFSAHDCVVVNDISTFVPSSVDISSSYPGYLSHHFQSIDANVNSLLLDIRGSIALKQKAESDPTAVSIDQKDSQAIDKALNTVIDQLTQENCMQQDGKARCGLSWCNKLFKGKEFLKKHISSKHSDVFHERLVRVLEPFMKARYDAEDITLRPLPPVEIESSGEILTKSIKEIRESALNRLKSTGTGSSEGANRRDSFGGRANHPTHRDNYRNNNNFNHRHSSGGGGNFHNRENQSRDWRGGKDRVPPHNNSPYESNNNASGRPPRQSPSGNAGNNSTSAPDNNDKRRLTSYMDVDTPLVSILLYKNYLYPRLVRMWTLLCLIFVTIVEY
jgi:hypothetical protein